MTKKLLQMLYNFSHINRGCFGGYYHVALEIRLDGFVVSIIIYMYRPNRSKLVLLFIWTRFHSHITNTNLCRDILVCDFGHLVGL